MNTFFAIVSFGAEIQRLRYSKAKLELELDEVREDVTRLCRVVQHGTGASTDDIRAHLEKHSRIIYRPAR